MAAILKAFNAKIDNHGLDGKSLPKSLKVLSWGKNETNDGDVFLNEESVKVFEAYQKKAGRDKSVALDFDHSTVRGSKEYVAGQPKAIAAYGDPEIIPGDGLYLRNLEWTPLGKQNARNYKDLSPAAVLDNRGVLLGLDSVALTPHGAVRDLNFFSSEGFNDNMLKQMSAETTPPDYNVGGANAGLKVSELAEPNGIMSDDDDDKDEYDEHDVDCKCASCMAAEDPSIQKKHLEEYDSEDHYSKYGKVAYADKENSKYPIDTKAHAKAAWSWINMPKNAKKYSGDKLSAIKSRIRSAAEKHGVEISDEKTTKTMSANSPLVADPKSLPDAYLAQPVQYRTMNDTIVKKMSANLLKALAADVGMEDESDSEKVLFAFLAKYKGLGEEVEGQITHKGNTSNGGLEGFEDRAAGSEKDNYGTKQYSADIDFLKKEIESLKTQKVQDTAKYNQVKVEELVNQASREGKIVPFSSDRLKNIDPVILEEVINNQPKYVVPVGAALRTMSVQEDRKPSREKAISAFNEQVAANVR